MQVVERQMRRATDLLLEAVREAGSPGVPEGRARQSIRRALDLVVEAAVRRARGEASPLPAPAAAPPPEADAS